MLAQHLFRSPFWPGTFLGENPISHLGEWEIGWIPGNGIRAVSFCQWPGGGAPPLPAALGKSFAKAVLHPEWHLVRRPSPVGRGWAQAPDLAISPFSVAPRRLLRLLWPWWAHRSTRGKSERMDLGMDQHRPNYTTRSGAPATAGRGAPCPPPAHQQAMLLPVLCFAAPWAQSGPGLFELSSHVACAGRPPAPPNPEGLPRAPRAEPPGPARH